MRKSLRFRLFRCIFTLSTNNKYYNNLKKHNNMKATKIQKIENRIKEISNQQGQLTKENFNHNKYNELVKESEELKSELFELLYF